MRLIARRKLRARRNRDRSALTIVVVLLQQAGIQEVLAEEVIRDRLVPAE
jgi:hypothetical protein